MKASDERKLANTRRAQQREEDYGIKTPWTNRIRTAGGGTLKPQRREVRDRRNYLTARDLRLEGNTLREEAATDDDSLASEFWTFHDTPSTGDNLSPIEFALVRFVDTKAPGLSLDAFVNYFDRRDEMADPVAEINDLGDMEQINSFGEATPCCMRVYLNIDELADQTTSLAPSLE